jgi:hypothetical protein
MKGQGMGDERFFTEVALLVEAARLEPSFARKVEEASTDERIDELVEQARAIVDKAATQAWI